ncbi:MAG: hypothetical protein HN396_04405 [Gemmatimonadales bacterium]|nr:hypothetical protein [Gemmatimonadales bacterium]
MPPEPHIVTIYCPGLEALAKSDASIELPRSYCCGGCHHDEDELGIQLPETYHPTDENVYISHCCVWNDVAGNLTTEQWDALVAERLKEYDA